MNKNIRSYLNFSSALLAGVFMVSNVTAQQAGSTGAKASSIPDGWFKICNTDPKSKREICALNIQLKGNTGKPLATVRVVEIKGVKQKGFTIVVPPGLLIQPGMRIQIDGAKTGTAKFQVCTPQACFVEARLGGSLITNMKRGNEMKVIGIGQNGKQVEFPVTLTGFTAAYDGAPIDPKVAAASQETLQQRLQRKAEEARKRLVEEKKPAEGEAAPAQSN